MKKIYKSALSLLFVTVFLVGGLSVSAASWYVGIDTTWFDTDVGGEINYINDSTSSVTVTSLIQYICCLWRWTKHRVHKCEACEG